MNHYTQPIACPKCDHRHPHEGMPLNYQGQELLINTQGEYEYTDGYMVATCTHCGYQQILKEKPE